jgi:hypothetical protein
MGSQLGTNGRGQDQLREGTQSLRYRSKSLTVRCRSAIKKDTRGVEHLIMHFNVSILLSSTKTLLIPSRLKDHSIKALSMCTWSNFHPSMNSYTDTCSWMFLAINELTWRMQMQSQTVLQRTSRSSLESPGVDGQRKIPKKKSNVGTSDDLLSRGSVGILNIAQSLDHPQNLVSLSILIFGPQCHFPAKIHFRVTLSLILSQ